MARRKRFTARRAKLEERRHAKEMEALDLKGRKIERVNRPIELGANAKVWGVGRRAEVRILEQKMRPAKYQRISFWTPEMIRNDPIKKLLVVKWNRKRKRAKG